MKHSTLVLPTRKAETNNDSTFIAAAQRCVIGFALNAV